MTDAAKRGAGSPGAEGIGRRPQPTGLRPSPVRAARKLKKEARLGAHVRARALLWIALLASATAAGCVTRDGDLEGSRAPDFSLVTTAGERVNLSTFEGRWLVLNLMATWCQYCVVETVHLKDVQAKYGDDVAILAVSVDRTETAADLDAFAREHGTDWPYAADPTGRVARDYRQTITPKTVIVDPDGIVRREVSGQVYLHTFTRTIEPASPVAAPAFAPLALAGAFAGGALAALSPYLAPHRARERGDSAWRRRALAAALAGGLSIVAALVLFADLAGTRALFVGIAVGALAVGGALFAALGRAKIGEAPDSPARAGGEVVYHAVPAILLALALALRAGGWLAFSLTFLATFAGFAAAWGAAARWPALARPRSAGPAALAALGIALALVAASDGVPV